MTISELIRRLTEELETNPDVNDSTRVWFAEVGGAFPTSIDDVIVDRGNVVLQ